jgi:transcriptional regulator with XRE-family HTH domain
MILMRTEIGDVLRDYRTERKMTLRDVSAKSSVALGYISEIERGQKEASSEVLASIVEALDVPLSRMLMEVADRLAMFEDLAAPITPIPDIIPEEFFTDRGKRDVSAKNET